jgi:glutathione S-transferase
VRDLRVRWALEEIGLPYSEKLLGPGDQNTPAHRAVQPFGQVPVYEEDGLTLFESGAILIHIGEKSEILLPKDPAKRARAFSWMFAALNSVEPHVQNLTTIDLFSPNEEWAKQRRPAAEKLALARLNAVATSLDSRDWLEGQFTVADLLMISVLRNLRHLSMVNDIPVLAAYVARGEARPPFQRALATQLAHFERNQPKAA